MNATSKRNIFGVMAYAYPRKTIKHTWMICRTNSLAADETKYIVCISLLFERKTIRSYLCADANIY